MNDLDTQLIAAAHAVLGERELGNGFTAGGVSAALRTAEGDIFTGICLELGCGLGFCAEVAAMAEMLKHGQTRIDTVVAVTRDKILPPCGRCRETMVQVDPSNLDCRVIIDEGQVVPLRELLPHQWLGRR